MSTPNGYRIDIQIDPIHTNLLNKLVEGYDNLALMTAVEARTGRFVLWVSQDTLKDMQKILPRLPFKVEIVSIMETRAVLDDVAHALDASIMVDSPEGQ